ncbi:MAG: PhzF family phenazine biosynthesis protein [Clostridia bacterium]
MKLYIIDAFTDTLFGGNPAGVVMCDNTHPSDNFMLALAAELGYSETAFVFPQKGGDSFQIRYFTPVCEVDLCGHATIAAFCALGYEGRVKDGNSYLTMTKAAELNIDIGSECVWMDMAAPISIGVMLDEDLLPLYAAFGLDLSAMPPSLTPELISTGLPDIIMPVNDTALFDMRPNFDTISSISKKYGVTGVHAFALNDDCTARCRNFAPLYGIDEEAATGTSNGALTYYLYKRDLIKLNRTNRFIQGESMGRPSLILSRLETIDGGFVVRIGGSGVILCKGDI